jgi:Phosphodiester glycosidase/FG-GAP-like repeat
VVLLPLLSIGLAFGGDSWSTPHTGVRLLHRTTSTPLEVWAAEVDLCERGVELRATAEDERQRTPSSFGSLVGAEVVINGDFFSYDDYYPSGLAVADGASWNDDNTTEGFIVFGRDHAWLSDPSESWTSLDSWMDQAVGGRPLLVEEGVAGSSFSDPSHCSDLHPRTAVGLSQDRQTLYLVVVDGRSSASDGITCPDLADLMVDLGAWTALNLDGGGSSAMWVSGEGTVNEPSDGSERTVSNHLAVLADGSGSPESCDFWLDEVVTQAHGQHDDNTDIDGDGRADFCARAGVGLHCYLATESGFGDGLELTSFSNDNGWSDWTNYASLRMGDITGDGRADVCARGNNGLYCWPSLGTDWGDRIDGPTISDDEGYSGWTETASLRLADIDGDGDQDACARGPEGFSCWPSQGTSFGAEIAGPDLSDGNGWWAIEHSGTIRLGDVNDDGRADVCARASAGMYCWLSDGSAFPDRIDGPAWSDTDGWDDVASWSTIRLVDVDGDGRSDLCGRSTDGFACALSTGSGFGEASATVSLSDASGWGDHSNYATIRMGDVDGDGDQDVCARADLGVYCWLYQDGSFAERIDGPTWSDDSGWSDHRYYTTIRLADVKGDGKADLCARAAAGMRCAASTGKGFATTYEGPGWSDAGGWDSREYYSTLRIGGPPPPPAADDSGGGDGGDDGGSAVDGGGDSASGNPGVEGEGQRITPGCDCGRGGAAVFGLLLIGLGRRRRSSATAAEQSCDGQAQ